VKGSVLLSVVDSRLVTSTLIECVVKCLAGAAHVGQHLQLSGPSRLDGDFEVLEIRYFDRLISELETNFGGQLLLRAASDGLIPGVGDELVGLESES
jgi:hypothetical protein